MKQFQDSPTTKSRTKYVAHVPFLLVAFFCVAGFSDGSDCESQEPSPAPDPSYLTWSISVAGQNATCIDVDASHVQVMVRYRGGEDPETVHLWIDAECEDGQMEFVWPQGDDPVITVQLLRQDPYNLVATWGPILVGDLDGQPRVSFEL